MDYFISEKKSKEPDEKDRYEREKARDMARSYLFEAIEFGLIGRQPHI